MGKSAPKAPAPPDPVATARAQTASNVGTAVANSTLGNANQYTPYGNLTFTDPGQEYLRANPDVASSDYRLKPYDHFITYGRNEGRQWNGAAPTWVGDQWVYQPSSTQTLNASDQSLLNKTGALENQAADIGGQLFGNVAGSLAQPLNYNGAPQLSANYDALRNSVYDASMARVNQDLDRQQAASDQRLANQGIAQGTEAAQAAADNISRARVDAGNQAWVGAGNQADQAFQQEMARRQQGIQEISTLRNAPINEVSGLFGIGPGIQQANFTPYQGGQVAPTDVIGAHNSAFQAANANYQAQVARQNAAKGGLGSLVGTGVGLAFRSDRRVKTGIRRVGTLDNGLPVYLYRFKDGGPFQIGVLAQEVERVRPEAVLEIGGVKHVRYDLATEA